MTIIGGQCRLREIGVHCATCKQDARWRESRGIGVCPHGRHKMGLGDLVALVATPIARAFRMDCIDPKTNDLRPDSGCAKRRSQLNRRGQASGTASTPP